MVNSWTLASHVLIIAKRIQRGLVGDRFQQAIKLAAELEKVALDETNRWFVVRARQLIKKIVEIWDEPTMIECWTTQTLTHRGIFETRQIKLKAPVHLVALQELLAECGA